MIDTFTIAGPLAGRPEEKTMKNGSRFMTAVFACRRHMQSQEARIQTLRPQEELIEVSFFDRACIELLRQAAPEAAYLVTGYIRSLTARRPDGSEHFVMMLVGTELQPLQPAAESRKKGGRG